MPASPPATYEEYLALFAGQGTTDEEYLGRHWRRFLQTHRLFSEQWSVGRGDRMLDVGAHWLHQSLLYAQAGYQLTAADFASTFEEEGLRSLAQANGISLYEHGDLDDVDTFAGLGEESIDIVLFSEVLEHLAFNPIDFWKSLYRVLAPGGRIVLTTPNFYFWKTRVRGAFRFLTRGGAGVSVDDILGRPTYAHHWKEYSTRELRHYFRLLSPDFRVNRMLCFAGRFAHLGFFGRSIYAEIDLPAKQHGIVEARAWS